MKRIALVLALLLTLGACDDDDDKPGGGGGGDTFTNSTGRLAVVDKGSLWHDKKGVVIDTTTGKQIGQITIDYMVAVAIVSAFLLLSTLVRKPQ